MPLSRITSSPRFRLSGPAALVEALPYLLGFRPRNSLIVVTLRSVPDATPQVVAMARVDLDPSAVVALVPLAERARAKGADHCIVVAVGQPLPATGPWDLTWVGEHSEALAVAVGVAGLLSDLEVPAIDLLVVGEVDQPSDPGHGGWRWRSAWCDRPDCCPVEGRFVADAGVVTTRAVGLGLSALPDRSGLSDELLPDEATRAQVAAALATPAGAARVDQAYRQQCIDELHTALDSGTAPTRLPVDQLARLLRGLTDVQVRDAAAVLGRRRRSKAGRPRDRELTGLRSAQGFWLGLTRCAPSGYVAPPATLLAMTNYRLGDGARANVALDRALEDDAAYPLATLLSQALFGGISPDELDVIFSANTTLRPTRTLRVQPGA
jgi:hypothetical protein